MLVFQGIFNYLPAVLSLCKVLKLVLPIAYVAPLSLLYLELRYFLYLTRPGLAYDWPLPSCLLLASASHLLPLQFFM